MTRNRLIGLVAVAALGIAVAIVLLRGPAEAPSPATDVPPAVEAFDPYAAAAEASAAAREAEEAAAEGSAQTAETVPAEGTGSRTEAEGTPGEGTGQGPTVGADPASAGQPVTVIHTDLAVPPDEEPVEGTGVGVDDDPDHGLGPGDAERNMGDEAQFFDNVQHAYGRASVQISDCLTDTPDLRDSLFVEMTVRDLADDPMAGDVNIAQFQSNALTEGQRTCVADVLTDMDVPPAWAAGTGEGPGFTTQSDSDIEYEIVFEFEVGAGE